jgi:hypothetical protein
MFKFSFRRKKKASQTLNDVRDLSEQELTGLFAGGTPVRHLSYPSNLPRWILNTASGADATDFGYYRHTQVFPGSQWQPNIDRTSVNNRDYYSS